MKGSLLGVCALAAVAALAASTSAWAGKHGRAPRAGVEHVSSDQGRYYVDFLARPEGIVGHSYIQAGALDTGGRRHPALTEGLYPANPAKVFDAAGKVTAMAADLKHEPGVRYRVMVSPQTYTKTLAYMKSLKHTWRRYDLIQHNCNNMVGDVARHLGLAAPADTSDLPMNYVSAIAAANDGRLRASWR